MYKPTQWKDHVEGLQEGTDLNAANLNNMERGTMEAQALAAFLAYHRSVGGNVPFVESKQPVGGYYREVPVVLPNGGVLTEKEWLVKPDTELVGEYRTTGRFAGCPVYEQELSKLNAAGELGWGLSREIQFDNNKINGGLKPFVIETVGCSISASLGTDWVAVNNEDVSVLVSKVSYLKAKVESSVAEGFAEYAITVRYIYIREEEE